MKATGKEIKQFYNDKQWDHLRHEEYGGEDMIKALKNNQEYSLRELGKFTDTNQDKIITFENAFKQWQRRNSHRTILVELPKEDLHDVIDQLKERGFFVRKINQPWKYSKLEE